MIYINRHNYPMPPVFQSREINIAKTRLEAFYMRPKSSRSQEKFNKPFEPELRDQFLSALRELFHGKCAYCESVIPLALTRSEYDHFRPKSGARGLKKEFSPDYYWWLTYEWHNLYYSCANCNQYKSTWFPIQGERGPIGMPLPQLLSAEKNMLIDPCFDRPEEHFAYKENGEIDFLTTQGKTTIEILKLNRAQLIESRREVVKNLTGQWTRFISLFSDPESGLDEINLITAEWGEIFNNEHSTKDYLGLRRYILQKWLSYANTFDYLNNRNFVVTSNRTTDEKRTEVSQTIAFETVKMDAGLTPEAKTIITEELKIDEIRHIYVEKIVLKNFKCFSYLELDFSKNDSIAESKLNDQNPLEPWILFLGENGVGKSSVLKAIALGLSGQEYINELGLSGRDILKHKADDGFIKVYVVGGIQPIEVTFDKDTIKTTLRQPIVNILAYNAIRLKPIVGKMVPEQGEFYGAKARNLFDYTFSLVDADNWLATLPTDIFDRAAMTLKDLMLLEPDDHIEIRNYQAILKRGDDELYIDELSDGYQSVFYLAVDIMATLAGENVTFDLAEGMVLIDEIGSHLHPRWRMEVISRLRKAFPKIRFVVSTHEPLCLRGLRNGETIVLAKNEDREIIALTELPDPSELRVDQLLTSNFFGLRSTIDPETEKLFNEYYAILALDDEQRTEMQKERLSELSSQIPHMKHFGDSLREDLAYYVIDELLAKQTRADGFKIEDLKTAAKNRVESLWKSIDQITGAK